MQNKKQPMRTCVGCRESAPKKTLIRVVRTPEGNICLDSTGKLNGRGAYLCRNEACLDKAMRSNALGRTFAAQIPAETYEALRKELKELDS